MIYSVEETTRANGLNVYYYIRHLLSELMKVKDAEGKIDQKNWNRSCPGQEVSSKL